MKAAVNEFAAHPMWMAMGPMDGAESDVDGAESLRNLLHEEDGAESDVDVNPPRAGAWAATKDEEDQEDDEANQDHEVTEQQPRVAIEDAEDHEDDEAEQEQQPMLISTMVARQLRRMRFQKDDPCSSEDVAGDFVQFI